METKVTAKINDSLLQAFQPEEIHATLQQMHPIKSPSPNGMPPIIFQRYWNIVGQNFSNCILNILNTRVMPLEMKETHICLIPKTKNPQKITKYRPISLCNVTYRILAKVLANRLKTVLPNVISESQSASVPGRLIIDNVLAAFETMHHINQRRKGEEREGRSNGNKVRHEQGL